MDVLSLAAHESAPGKLGARRRKGMSKQPRIRVRHTPYGLHPYVAHIKGEARYGWGQTPAEARAKLVEQLAKHTQEDYVTSNKLAETPRYAGTPPSRIGDCVR